MVTTTLPVLERWILAPSADTCEGCRYLARVGLFRRGVGPEPGLHPYCNCVRRRVSFRGLSLAAINLLTAEADANGARAGRILTRALNLRDRS
jgi:hypothetical protein